MKEISNKKISIFQHFLCPIDWKLNRILKRCLKLGMKEIRDCGHFHLFTEVTFNGFGINYEFWDCERWDGWLKFGTFKTACGVELYKYTNKRPTRRTVQRFLNALKEHIKSACPNGEGISR